MITTAMEIREQERIQHSTCYRGARIGAVLKAQASPDVDQARCRPGAECVFSWFLILSLLQVFFFRVTGTNISRFHGDQD